MFIYQLGIKQSYLFMLNQYHLRKTLTI